MVNHGERAIVSDASAGFAKLPASVIEVESEFVLGARFGGSRRPAVRRLAVAGLDRGVVQPSAVQSNVPRPELLRRALETVSKSIGDGGGRTVLLLPDAAVRVCLLEFETLPAKAKELEALLGWRIKDSLGFPPDDARLSYQETQRAPGFVELLVVAMKKDVLAQYEAVVERIRRGIVCILPASLALLPLLSEEGPGAQLLIHVCSGCVTHAVVEGKRLRFWRSRELAPSDSDAVAGEVVSEASRAVASARDRLKLEIERAWCCARPPGSQALTEALAYALKIPVLDLPFGPGLENALGADEKRLFSLFGAPLAGVASNVGRPS